MGFKSFRLVCVVRITLLAATILLLVYLVSQTSLLATSLIVGAAIVAQVVSLVHYVEKTNRDLTRFLASIRYSDFSQAFSSSQRGSSFEDLNAAFASVISEFQKARSEKETQYRYLQTLVQHIGLGILSFDQTGKVDLVNNASKRLLRITHLRNINSLASVSPRLVETLTSSKPGEKALVKIDRGDLSLTLAIHHHPRLHAGHRERTGRARDGGLAEVDPGSDPRDHELGYAHSLLSLDRRRPGKAVGAIRSRGFGSYRRGSQVGHP
jgi:nitrogen fixation/metabolism regulation signal transduction histidine kinase